MIKETKIKNIQTTIKRDRALIVMIIPVVIYYLIFHYKPMYGILIAFKNFSISKGILRSEWAGLKYFMQFFQSYFFPRLLRNTVLISVYGLIWGFPIPILFALFLNEIKNGYYKKIVQTASYLPYFISTVVVVGIIYNLLSPQTGVIANVVKLFNGTPVNYMISARYFRTIYISSGIWQGFGINSILYIAAISGIEQEQYEAAIVDGASRFAQTIHITIPGILPTVIILLILNLGKLMSVGYEKIILMYSPSIYEVADVISTYTFRKGIFETQYSFAAAVGFFNSVINFILLIIFNKISKMISEISLW
jgi:putative aldouronate transport system permease protein